MAGREDLEELIELENSSIKEEQFHSYQLKYLLLKAKSMVLVASIDGKIAGSLVVLLRSHIANARIYILNVHPSYRRIGIASSLMDAAIRMLKERGFEKITIETGINNYAALKLYNLKGFTVDKILKKYYKNGMDAKHLILNLK